jgi:hypothetical protein
MHKGTRKPQAYPWICRGFLRILDAQEIGADRVENHSIWVKASFVRIDNGFLSRGFVVILKLKFTKLKGFFTLSGNKTKSYGN